MNKRDISEAASILADLIFVGVPIVQSVRTCADLQPRNHAFWLGVASQMVSNDLTLSGALMDKWPRPLTLAIEAGELSGNMEAAFREITSTTAMEEEAKAAMRRLIPPALTLLVAVLVTLGIYVFAVPVISQSMARMNGGRDSTAGLASASIALRDFLVGHWVVLLGGFVVGAFAVVTWLRSEGGRDALRSAFVSLPWLGEKIRAIEYGVWASYVALLLRSGVSIVDCMERTAMMLPGSMRTAVLTFRQRIAAGEPMDKVAMSTPWPFFLSYAFALGHNSGVPDEELTKVIPRIKKRGMDAIFAAAKTASVVVTILTSTMIGSAFMVLYSPIIGAIQGGL